MLRGDADSLVITSFGMTTSVGRDAAQSCAAMRAGITRPTPLPYFSLVDESNGEGAPLIAHPISGLTDGFLIVGRWLRMAHAACTELMVDHRSSDTAARPDARTTTAIIAVLPLCDAARFGIDDDASFDIGVLNSAFLTPLCKLLRLTVPEERRFVVAEGHAGTASAMARARALVAQGSADEVIVVGVDSYLDPGTLTWLQLANRLHGPSQPEGFAPGEAAAAVLVTSARRCAARGRQPKAFVMHGASEPGESQSHLDAPALGAHLGRVWSGLLQMGAPPDADVIVDLNGERWRSEAFGHAQARTAKLARADAMLSTPATSIGDVGAATGLVHLGIAARSIARRHARGPATVLLNQSDDGRVGAMLVQPPASR